ncbi:hypothetical protein FS837_008165 [Tulasnella sp. UAMH 9824]|nr:hypothetical protein FS837_008165 [Tulasnella sp. UAMH 9824]
MASSSSSSLPVPQPSGLASRRLTARALPSLVIPPPATLKPASANASLLNLPTSTNHHHGNNNNDSPPALITPAMAHFPPVCPPAPAPQTHRQLHPLPTIVLPDLQADDNHHHHLNNPPATANPLVTNSHNMKAQPTTTLTSARARVNTVYPPSKRALSYNNAQRQPGLSPKSMAVASILKRKGMSSPRPQTQRTSSSSSAVKQATPPQPARARISQQAHERALAAQRNAALAQRQATRLNHLGSLDRGIQLLLEEEYREDVKAWMLEKEKQTLASASAMDQQPELQWHMRSHLLDFLIEIHLHFRLRPETLYLTLSILDRYVSRRIVYKKHYQLVGCVALWLAAKFEDAKERVPSVRDLKELCHGAYQEDAFVQMEFHVLTTIDWDLGHPTAESWLRVLCTETHLPSTLGMSFGMFGAQGALGLVDGTPFEDTRTQHVARFLMEMTLYGRDYIQFVPSTIALGALVLSRHICGKPRRPQDESPAVLQMISLLDSTLSQNLDSVSQTLVKKYSYAYYSKASGVVVSFYLRGGRFTFNPAPATTIEVPESLSTNVVSVDALRTAAAQASRNTQQVPVTPTRERMDLQWGSGRTDVEETPGLVRSDSSSSVVGMEVEDEADEVMSTRSFSHPRELEEMDDEEDDTEDDDHVEVVDQDDDEDELDGAGVHYASAAATANMLHVPSDELESLPITPTTPMFQLDPFGSAQAHAAQVQQQAVVQVQHHTTKDKENLAPTVNGGAAGHHQYLHASNATGHLPCAPMMPSNVGVMVESGEENMPGSEYRQALLAIVP